MRKSGIDSTMMDLGRLLDSLHMGEVALPDFQRDFDWSDSDIQQLLMTVFSGWPAGSLLLMSGKQELFRLRGFEGGTSELDGVKWIVLDGQQRLTSLYHALYNRGPNVYAINYRMIADGGELEDAITSFPRHEWEAKYKDARAQVQGGFIPCFELTSATTFFEWRDAAIAAVSEDQQANLKDSLTDTYTRVLSAIHNYEFPVVTLEESVEPAAIARIFERVNRYGMRLNTFDLMVAKVYDPEWNLRTKWEAVRRERPIIDTFLEEDGMPILQTIALLHHNDIRQSAVLSLRKRLVHDNWDTASIGVEAALQFLEECCGVTSSLYIPYRSMIVLFGAVAVDYHLRRHHGFLQRFFWSRSFAQAYDVATNTRIVADYKDLVQFLKEEYKDSGQFTLLQVDPSDLYFSARRSHRAIWAAFVCALTVADPSGLFVDLTEQEDKQREEPAAARRIVPLLQRGLEPDTPDAAPPHLRVLAMVRTSRYVATLLSRKGIRLMIDDLIEEHGQEPVDRSLKQHLLPGSAEIRDTVEDWPELLSLRRTQLMKFLEQDLGISFEVMDERA